MWSFRWRVRLAENERLGINEIRVISRFRDHEMVISGEKGELISESNPIVFTVKGLENQEVAELLAEEFRHNLMILFLLHNINADLTYNEPTTFVPKSGEPGFKALFGIDPNATLRPNRNLDVYEDIGSIVFFDSEAKLTKIQTEIESLMAGISGGIYLDKRFSKRETYAFNLLYLSAAGDQHIMTRFLLTYLAFESLIIRGYRDTQVLMAIDMSIDVINQSQIAQEEKDLIITSLGSLKQEGVKQATERTLQPLNNKEFMDLKVSEFMKKCAETRNQIVHKGTCLTNDNSLVVMTSELRKVIVDLLLVSRVV